MTKVTAGEKRTLVINPSTREIIVPKSERVFGSYNECGIERKYFLCPRIIGNNVDLTECFIFVNYISSGGNEGQILCDDVEITEDGTCVVFSWELTRNVFDENKDATIYFSVHAKKVTDGRLKVLFATKIAQGRAAATIDSTGEILQKNADVIVQLLERIVKLEGKTSPEQMNEAIETYFNEKPTVLAKSIQTNETLKVTPDGKLSVNTANEASKDNTLPITAAAVHTQIGNINTLLETI